MGLMDRLKKVTGTDNDGYNYEDDYYNEFGAGEEIAEEEDLTADAAGVSGLGMSGMGGSGISLSGTALELKVVKPQHFESVQSKAIGLVFYIRRPPAQQAHRGSES